MSLAALFLLFPLSGGPSNEEPCHWKMVNGTATTERVCCPKMVKIMPANRWVCLSAVEPKR